MMVDDLVGMAGYGEKFGVSAGISFMTICIGEYA
jgi:hypothetical protein